MSVLVSVQSMFVTILLHLRGTITDIRMQTLFIYRFAYHILIGIRIYLVCKKKLCLQKYDMQIFTYTYYIQHAHV